LIDFFFHYFDAIQVLQYYSILSNTGLNVFFML